MLLVTRRIARVVAVLSCLVLVADAVGAAGDTRRQAATVTIRAAAGSAAATVDLGERPVGEPVVPPAPVASAPEPETVAPADPVAPDPVAGTRPPVASPEPIGASADPSGPSEIVMAAPDPPVGPPCAGVQNALVAEVVERVNALRAQHGVGPLAWDGQLSCLAREWSERMAGERVMRHRDLYPVLRSDGWFRWVTLAENLVAGGTVMDARTVVNVWLTSPEHLATMLSGEYQWTGIGIATTGDLMYVTQNFGRLR